VASIEANLPAQEPRRKSELSSREVQIVNLAATGLTDKEIGQQLGLSLSTVKSYWGRIRHKTGSVNRMQVVVKGLTKTNTRTPDLELLLGALRGPTSLLLSCSPFHTMVLDSEGQIRYSTHRPEDVVGRQWVASLPPTFRSRAQAALEQVLSKGEPQMLLFDVRLEKRLLVLQRGWLTPLMVGENLIGVAYYEWPEE
jgi:DNA-binding CsgD family transcriptional regulator